MRSPSYSSEGPGGTFFQISFTLPLCLSHQPESDPHRHDKYVRPGNHKVGSLLAKIYIARLWLIPREMCRTFFRTKFIIMPINTDKRRKWPSWRHRPGGLITLRKILRYLATTCPLSKVIEKAVGPVYGRYFLAFRAIFEARQNQMGASDVYGPKFFFEVPNFL